MFRQRDKPMNKKIVVIGAVNIDICGKPFSRLLHEDLNPGSISYSIGGVGFNIARNLSLLGNTVHFVAVLGDDRYLPDIKAEAEKYSIDLSHSFILKGESNSCYLFITDENGDMILAVNDMEINRLLTKDRLQGVTDFLNSCDAVLVDTNLTEETISYITSQLEKPVFADSVSAAKAPKIRNSLKNLTAFKPNHIEAEALTGIKITDTDSARAAAEALLSTGLKRLFLTLGSQGVLAAEQNCFIQLPPLCTEDEIVNTSGAGDAFFASAIDACLEGKSLQESALAGLRGSRASCLCCQSVNKDILKFVK